METPPSESDDASITLYLKEFRRSLKGESDYYYNVLAKYFHMKSVIAFKGFLLDQLETSQDPRVDVSLQLQTGDFLILYQHDYILFE